MQLWSPRTNKVRMTTGEGKLNLKTSNTLEVNFDVCGHLSMVFLRCVLWWFAYYIEIHRYCLVPFYNSDFLSRPTVHKVKPFLNLRFNSDDKASRIIVLLGVYFDPPSLFQFGFTTRAVLEGQENGQWRLPQGARCTGEFFSRFHWLLSFSEKNVRRAKWSLWDKSPMVVITIKGEEVNLGYYLAMQTAVGQADR